MTVLGGRPGPHRDPGRRGQPGLGGRRSDGHRVHDGSLNPEALIDGTEATNWGGVTAAQVDESHPSVAVDLVGDVRR